MNLTRSAAAISILLLSPIAAADNSSAQSTAFGGEGGSATGGAGGLGGTGIGNGGTGGTGFGGEAYGGAGGTGQGGAAMNEGNHQSASMNFDQIRQSPAVFMQAPMATAPCQASIGGFLSFIGGIGLAGSRTLEECEKREASRISYAIGQTQMALEIMCMTEYGSKTSVCKDTAGAK